MIPAFASHMLVHFGVPGYAFHYVPALLALGVLGIGATEGEETSLDGALWISGVVRRGAFTPGRNRRLAGRSFPVLSHRLRSRRLAWEFRPFVRADDPSWSANADAEPPA